MLFFCLLFTLLEVAIIEIIVFIVMLDLHYNIRYCFIVDNIQNQATFDNNEPLGDIGDEGEPPLSPSMITTKCDRQYHLRNDQNIDMISPSDNNTEEIQSNDNVSLVTVSSNNTSSGANTPKQEMKVSGA